MKNIKEPIHVVAAEAQKNHILQLKFNDGSVKTFDCKPFIRQYPAFAPLQDEKVFHDITLDGWTVTWNNGSIDIAPEYLYEHGHTVYDSTGSEPGMVAEAGGGYKG
ncbi:MAG: DUF2442 domain-containing protein [Bacteroidales bacterium]|nr:DUF2442 domain-containing protein [Bacteroidales bacterium]